MDREWYHKEMDACRAENASIFAQLATQGTLIEDLNDRVATLEECARVTPVSRRGPRKASKNKELPL